jgi:hypothetical protein
MDAARNPKSLVGRMNPVGAHQGPGIPRHDESVPGSSQALMIMLESPATKAAPAMTIVSMSRV